MSLEAAEESLPVYLYSTETRRGGVKSILRHLLIYFYLEVDTILTAQSKICFEVVYYKLKACHMSAWE